MAKTHFKFSPPLLSMKGLFYFGLVLFIISAYVVISFYMKFGADLNSKSLTFGQHVQLSSLSVLSLSTTLFLPLFFFTFALLYRSIRLRSVGIWAAMRQDIVILLPLTLLIWIYGAYFEQSVNATFYAMLWDIEELEPGQPYIENQVTADLFEMPGLVGLRLETDEIQARILDVKLQFERGAISEKSYFEMTKEYQYQQRMKQNKIMLIHLLPIYVLLFGLFGMILGYLVKLKLLYSILFHLGIGYLWYYFNAVVTQLINMDHANSHFYIVGVIACLMVLNTCLFILANKKFNHEQST